MPNAQELAQTGRRDLDTPPKPATPPEAQPRLAQMTSREDDEEQAKAVNAGSLQQTGIILQTAASVEKAVNVLASLLPGFNEVAAQINSLLRNGVNGSLQGAGEQGNNLPSSASPLQQGLTPEG